MKQLLARIERWFDMFGNTLSISKANTALPINLSLKLGLFAVFYFVVVVCFFLLTIVFGKKNCFSTYNIKMKRG